MNPRADKRPSHGFRHAPAAGLCVANSRAENAGEGAEMERGLDPKVVAAERAAKLKPIEFA